MQIYLYFSEHKSLIPLVVRTQAVLPLPSALSPQPSYISPQPSYISHHTSYISVKQVPVPHVPSSRHHFGLTRSSVPVEMLVVAASLVLPIFTSTSFRVPFFMTVLSSGLISSKVTVYVPAFTAASAFSCGL